MIDEKLLPPQSIEAEESILGGILFDPKAIGRVIDVMVTEAFYVQAHQEIYQGALALHSQGKPTDLITVTIWLRDHHLLDHIGGTAYLAQLVDRTVSAVNIDRYAALVMDKYLRRQLISAGHEIVDLGYDSTQNLEVVFDEAEKKIFSLTQNRPQEGLIPLNETLIHTFQEMEQLQQQTALPGIATDFYDLDAMTGGFQRSDLIIIAGRPSMGKTILGMNIAEHAAIKARKPVLVFSMEMPADSLAMRMMSSLGRIDQHRIRTGKLDDDDWPRVTSAVHMLSEAPLFIDDTAALSPSEMRARARRLVKEHGPLGLIVVDYLQ